MKQYLSECGREFLSSGALNGHISKCSECKSQIKEKKEKWNKKCECGCGRVTKYKTNYFSRRCYYNIPKSKELKDKITITLQEKYLKDPTLREAVSKRTKKAMSSKEVKVKLKNRAHRKVTDEDKLILSLRLIKRWEDPVERELLTQVLKESREGSKGKRSKAMKKVWSNKEYKKKLLKIFEINCHTLESEKKRSETMKKVWSNEKYKKETSKKSAKVRAEKIASGEIKINYGNTLKGYYKEEFYSSSYELNRMKYYDENNILWTKKHKIIIPYVDNNGKKHYYIPDFKIIENNKIIIEEIKGYIKEYDKEKALAAIEFCKKNNMKYRFLLGKDFKLIEELSFI